MISGFGVEHIIPYIMSERSGEKLRDRAAGELAVEAGERTASRLKKRQKPVAVA